MKPRSSDKSPFACLRPGPVAVRAAVFLSLSVLTACAGADRPEDAPEGSAPGDGRISTAFAGGTDLRRECPNTGVAAQPDHYRLMLAPGPRADDFGADGRLVRVYDVKSLPAPDGAAVSARTLSLSGDGEVAVGPDDHAILTAAQFDALRRHLARAFSLQAPLPGADTPVWTAGGCHDGRWFFAAFPLSDLPGSGLPGSSRSAPPAAFPGHAF
jgi:hypothetical protein